MEQGSNTYSCSFSNVFESVELSWVIKAGILDDHCTIVTTLPAPLINIVTFPLAIGLQLSLLRRAIWYSESLENPGGYALCTLLEG